jgi:hypothetical protein
MANNEERRGDEHGLRPTAGDVRNSGLSNDQLRTEMHGEHSAKLCGSTVYRLVKLNLFWDGSSVNSFCLRFKEPTSWVEFVSITKCVPPLHLQ